MKTIYKYPKNLVWHVFEEAGEDRDSPRLADKGESGLKLWAQERAAPQQRS